MPPKQRTGAPQTASGTPYSAAKSQSANDAHDIVQGVWNRYVEKTPQRTKLLDSFMLFLVVVGALQFLYVVLVGNFVSSSWIHRRCIERCNRHVGILLTQAQPFNAFLSGFSACVGQFVLTASLRIQTNPENKADFESISHERAFADFVFGSLLLHFFCVNFIN